LTLKRQAPYANRATPLGQVDEALYLGDAASIMHVPAEVAES
jgi:hypothetical protein